MRLDLNENPGGIPKEFIDETFKNITPEFVSQYSDDIELLILLNPNNPIGNAYSNEEFERIITAAEEHQITVLVDEAYMYFYNNTFINYALNRSHILVTRTFSKLFSLGSGRVGYIVGQPNEIKLVSKLCTPHNTNAYVMLLAKKMIETPKMIDEMICKQLEMLTQFARHRLKKNVFRV